MRPANLIVVLAILLGGIQATGQQKPALKSSASTASCGPLAGQTFTCPKFGFTYQVPFGWVDRTEDMREDDNAHSGSSENGDSARPDRSRTESKTLLAVFARPPFAPGETVDSAVIIASESLSDYPKIKTAADYFGPITEIAEQRGFKVTNEPYEVSLGNKRLVRGDFTNPAGKLTIYQTSLVMIDKGQIVSFTFVGGSEEEIEDLIAHLSFAAPKARAHN